MIYVDNFYEATGRNFGRMKMCHMIADSTQELLEMCDKIGVQRKWIQEAGTPREHFDICLSKRKLAIKFGAKEINMRELAKMTSERNAPPAKCEQAIVKSSAVFDGNAMEKAVTTIFLANQMFGGGK